MREIRLTLLVLAVAAATAAPAAWQGGVPEDAGAGLAEELLALPTDEAREALLAGHGAPVRAALPRALVNAARSAIDRTEYDRARAAYEIAIDLARRLDDRTNLAAALIGLGSVHGRQGAYAAAADRLRAGLAVAEALDDVERIDAALHNLGIVHRLQGEYEQALAYYQRVIALAEATDRTAVLGPTYNNIGIVHMLRGHYRAALDALHRSLALKEVAGERASLRSTLANIGIVHVQQGHPELALDYYGRSLALADELGLQARTAGTLNDVGHANAALGRHELALDYYRRALALHEAAGQRAEAAAALYNIGQALAASGRRDAARESLARSRDIREAINDRPGLAESLVALGALALDRGDPASALDLADRASRLSGETGTREAFWQGRLLAGRALEARGNPGAARDAYLEAIDTIEALRTDVAGTERDRQRYFERKLEPFHRLVALQLAQDRPRDALTTAERARARVLLDVLREGPAERRLLSPDERERERALERRLSDLQSRLWAERTRARRDADAIRRLESETHDARLAHGEMRAALYASHPALRLQRGDAAAGSPDAAAAVLEDDRTAILEFLVAERATYLFVVTRAPAEDGSPGVRVASFALDLPRQRLADRVDAFRRQLESRDLGFRPEARALFDAVLGPAATALEGRTHLVIVPDAALWALPFPALVLPSDRYLVEQAAISYAPSIGVLRELRARGRRTARDGAPRLVAFGDPGGRANGRDAAALPPLPDAARQVAALGRLYGPASSRVLTGARAGERELLASSADAEVLHFATHGLVDDAAPMYSYLALAAGPGVEAESDGRLEAWEIADLRLRAEAVVVAGCETALGRVGPGEGMIGLSWAFFLAGSPRTVASLWKVDAAGTTDLMLAFHRRFRDGLARRPDRPDGAASLREGALALLRGERYRHPFYWAGFVLVGDGS